MQKQLTRPGTCWEIDTPHTGGWDLLLQLKMLNRQETRITVNSGSFIHYTWLLWSDCIFSFSTQRKTIFFISRHFSYLHFKLMKISEEPALLCLSNKYCKPVATLSSSLDWLLLIQLRVQDRVRGRRTLFKNLGRRGTFVLSAGGKDLGMGRVDGGRGEIPS